MTACTGMGSHSRPKRKPALMVGLELGMCIQQYATSPICPNKQIYIECLEKYVVEGRTDRFTINHCKNVEGSAKIVCKAAGMTVEEQNE